ncbi:hypothetical protein [Vibrio coralliilyticus]|uniref:hypothetical protein n=1 Tax=Vibrio coralliilyticus TaxID=190893 RepID=UPI0017F3D332|nr:hypothetical protein [Vibrio coralliilyticus]NUW69224.1 hypothetical protein [Vibrio coralliilyticus]
MEIKNITGLMRKHGFSGSSPLDYDLYDARKGSIYVLSTIEPNYLNSNLSFSLTSNFISGGGIKNAVKDYSNNLIDKLGMNDNRIVKTAQVVHSKVSGGLERVRTWISEMFESFIGYLTNHYGDHIKYLNWFVELGVYLTSELVGNIASAISGMATVQTVSDVIDGTRQACTNVIRFVQQCFQGRGISVAKGHPTYIVRSISSQTFISAMEGLALAAVSVGKVAVTGTGIDVIISLVYNLVTRIFLFINTIVQKKLLNNVLSVAKKEWASLSTNALFNRPDEFNNWFKDSVLLTPVTAYLLVRSGYVSHPYKLLDLLDNRGKIISERKYLQGEKYIKRIKSNSNRLLSAYGEAYNVEFKSSDTSINYLLSSTTGANNIVPPDYVQSKSFRRRAIRRK